MPVVSVTRLRLRSWRFLPGFLIYALRSERQARHSPGNLWANVLNDSKITFWTCTGWTDEAALKAFLVASPHLQVMKKLPVWCDEAAVVRWTQDHTVVPEWKEAHRRLLAEGRLSKVTYPSADHQAFHFAAPRAK